MGFIWGLYGTSQNQFRKNQLLVSLSHLGLYDLIFMFFRVLDPKPPNLIWVKPNIILKVNFKGNFFEKKLKKKIEIFIYFFFF